MKNDYYIIYNPVSSSGKSHKIFNKFSTYLNQQSIPFQSIKSEYKGHIQKICQSIDIYNYVIIIGGDGTIHEAINGLMLNPNLEQMTIGFLPGGTGNSFLHDLNAETYSKAISKLITPKIKKIDVLKLELKNEVAYSFNIVGWGLVSDINILSEKLRFLGAARYTIASIYYIFRKKLRKATIIIDGQVRKDNYLFIMCLNTIHTGKGMKAAPNAKLDDGLLDIILLDSKISIIGLLFLLPKIFTGKHIESKYIDYLQAKSLSIKPLIDEILNIDGENKLKTPVKVSVLPQKINIFY
tara:strand:- start:110 stop:997 length:888 start_codon:yes stop_codon:yes gene_type:complete